MQRACQAFVAASARRTCRVSRPSSSNGSFKVANSHWPANAEVQWFLGLDAGRCQKLGLDAAHFLPSLSLSSSEAASRSVPWARAAHPEAFPSTIHPWHHGGVSSETWQTVAESGALQVLIPHYGETILEQKASIHEAEMPQRSIDLQKPSLSLVACCCEDSLYGGRADDTARASSQSLLEVRLLWSCEVPLMDWLKARYEVR